MSESGSDVDGRSPGPAFPPGRETGGESSGRDSSGRDGEKRAEAALGPLEGLAGLPVREHVAVFDEVFSGLEVTLASVEESGESHGL
jgi:hypothetical protein